MQLLRQLDEQASELDDVRQLITAVVQSAHFFRQRGREDQWLYRGMEVELHPQDGVVSVHQPRKDRRPLSSSPIMHKALDKRLQAQFGIPYRSQGLFVTGNHTEAKSYGAPALILPEGQFKFCWGRRVNDAFARFDLGSSFRYLYKEARNAGQDLNALPPINELRSYVHFLEDNAWAMEIFNDWFDEQYKEGEYSDTNLSDAIDMENEIMISCEQYAIVPEREFIRGYYVNAAEHILGGPLELPKDPNMKDFINAIAKKVVH